MNRGEYYLEDECLSSAQAGVASDSGGSGKDYLRMLRLHLFTCSELSTYKPPPPWNDVSGAFHDVSPPKHTQIALSPDGEVAIVSSHSLLLRKGH